MTNTFFYEDGQENVYNEQGIKAFDPMGDTLTQITDPNIVLETITSQSTYLAIRKSTEEKIVKKSDDIKPKAVTKPKSKLTTYNDYSDKTREVFIDRMLESAEERERIVRFAKELSIEPRTARRCSFTFEHEEHIRNLLDEDPQLYTEDIIDSLSKQFMGFSISKTQLNHHLRNNMLVTIKKPTFEP
ncbi:hypothetical protein G6F37_012654 [Rhizopus arrhizus]|nr:hypothetical protein G6F38_012687 [Rhizopus arrhizus]KAG1142357.1 hypothetical protein G6F37_012654 [Rhizopus arrhizus]